MKCPKCLKVEMKKEIYEGVEIDRCPGCKGVFLDKGELTKLVKADQGNIVDDLKFSPTSDIMDAMAAHCPRCDRDMRAYDVPGEVTVNLCESCAAIFLDQGELATIQLHLQS